MTNASKDHTRQEFSERFRKALEQRGYSPSQVKRLATLFGVSISAIRKWLDGLAIPTSARVPAIASKLGVRRAWLQDGEEPMFPEVAGVVASSGRRGKARPSDVMALSNDQLEWLCDYQHLTPEQRKAVREIVSLYKKGNKR